MEKVQYEATDQPVLSFTIPNDLKTGETIHLILEVTDDGVFPMTRYQRAIITCEN